MKKIRLRQYSKLKYRDPRPFLVRLRTIDLGVALSSLPPDVKQLRTNKLKSVRELREAAIFCYGVGQRNGETVCLAPNEAQDHDFVASWVADQVQNIIPVQLKEVVPTHRNPKASIQSVIDGLAKYVDSEDLVVAIHLNQCRRFNPGNLHIPELRIAQLWIFGAISGDQSEWGLWGDFLQKWEETHFAYPT